MRTRGGYGLPGTDDGAHGIRLEALQRRLEKPLPVHEEEHTSMITSVTLILPGVVGVESEEL